jgi:hypothetical protein
MTAQEWALRYASLGWRVFPVVAGGKRPLYRGWQRGATTDPEQVARYWRADPGPNIGIVCGATFDAFDIEAEHLPAFVAAMRADGLWLPATPVARTGRGGIHILTRTTGIDAGRDITLGGVHIGELKSRGGFIVACPSVTTGPYRWRFDPMVYQPADAPAWLVDLARRERRRSDRLPAAVMSAAHGRRRLDALTRGVRRAPVGRRNNVLYWAVRRALEEGIPARYAELALTRAGEAAGLDRTEVARTVASAIDGGAAA